MSTRTQQQQQQRSNVHPPADLQVDDFTRPPPLTAQGTLTKIADGILPPPHDDHQNSVCSYRACIGFLVLVVIGLAASTGVAFSQLKKNEKTSSDLMTATDIRNTAIGALRLWDESAADQSNATREHLKSRAEMVLPPDCVLEVCAPSTGCGVVAEGLDALVQVIYDVALKRVQSRNALENEVITMTTASTAYVDGFYSGFEWQNPAIGAQVNLIQGYWKFWLSLHYEQDAEPRWMVDRQVVERTFTSLQAQCGDGVCNPGLEDEAPQRGMEEWCPHDCQVPDPTQPPNATNDAGQ